MREATAAAVGQSHATMYRGKKSKKKKRRSVLLYHTSVERRSWYSAVDGFLDRFSRMRTELVEVLRVRDVVLLLWLVRVCTHYVIGVLHGLGFRRWIIVNFGKGSACQR